MAEKNLQKPRPCRNLMLEFENAAGENDNNLKTMEEEQRQSADLENEINDLLSTSLQSKIQKWNFDFVNETPLEGDWNWNFDEEGDNERARNPPADGEPSGDDDANHKFIHFR